MSVVPDSAGKENPETQLEITGMAYGGKGVARLDGKVYFVSDTVEGDVVRARILEDKDRYANAEVTAFVKESPLRTTPRCRFIGTCGGCQWMGIDYDQQLEWKRQFIVSSLKRIGKLPDLDVVVRPSPDIYQYRNRVLIRVHIGQPGQLSLGYFSRGSRNLVPIDRCEIACEPINELIKSLHAMAKGQEFSDICNIKFRLEIQELPHASGKISVTVYPGEGDRKMTKAVATEIAALGFVGWAGMVFDLPDAKEMEFDRQFDRTFLTLPGQFQQVNVKHNQNLRTHIYDLAASFKPKRILDVFCGSGNLSIGLADGERSIEGVEANKTAIACAQKNVALNKLTQMTYIAGDAEKHLRRCVKNKEKFDLVLLDPPRQGFHGGMADLKEIGPKHIIYVSCDPTTLARDIGALSRDNAYSVKSVTGYDFFPHTYHVETVIILQKSGYQSAD